MPVRLGSTKKRMLLTEAIGIERQSNEFPELEPFKMAGEELIEYLLYIYHHKMDSENAQSYHQVKTRRFELDNKHKCQIKRNHSSTHVSLAASAILFRKLCRLFQISSGRDGRASKSGRRPIERTGIVLPIPAALPLAQTNRLFVCWRDIKIIVFIMGVDTGVANAFATPIFSVCKACCTNKNWLMRYDAALMNN